MPSHSMPGRSLVTRRALADIVRRATLGSYGVTGFAARPLERLAGMLGGGQPGLRLDLSKGVSIELHLTVAYGLPVAEVARQVDSAVRYAVRRSLGREVDRIAIHVGALRLQPGALPHTDRTEGPAVAAGNGAGPDDEGADAQYEAVRAGRDAP